MRLSNNPTSCTVILLVLGLICAQVSSQVPPTWFATSFLESHTFLVVNNNQKTNGTYTQNLTFQSTFPGPSLALAIPQLRIVSNDTTLGFSCDYANLTSTAFAHQLTVNAPTSVWYLLMRYLVFQTLLSPNLQPQVNHCLSAATVINANTGTIRTVNDTTATVLSYTMGDDLYCLPYLVGFSASSNDNIQLNLTCTITATQTITITATVHPDTKILSFSAYILLFDKTYLAIASYYFVDTAITTSKYGVQNTFLSLPYGYFDTQYLGGLSSFSTRDNYQFNITLSPYNFVTSASSFYDGVPNFHLRARLCSYPYTFYNKVDGLCYVGCPAGTYPVATYQTCEPCHYSCLTCLNGTTCTSCPALRTSTSGTTTCTCLSYYYQYNNTCYACHYSCLTCTYQGQYFQCLTCDSSAPTYRTSVAVSGFNLSCPCQQNFTDTGITQCQQICGDGLVFILPCDDGNNVDGDGCSSTCQIQQYFTCITNTTSHTSKCTFSANVTMTVKMIQKLDYQNTVFFYIQVQPWNQNMQMLTNNSNPCLTSNVTNSSTWLYFHSPYLVYKATYNSALENTYLRFDLIPLPGSIFYGLPPANVTIFVQSTNGLPIQTYNTYQYRVSYIFYLCNVVMSSVMLLTVLLFCFGRFKLIGNQLFFTLQMMHLSVLLMNKFTPMLSGLAGTKYAMGYNDAIGKYQDWHPRQPIVYLLGFSILYEHNVNIMMAVEGFAIIMYCIYALTYLYNKRKYRGTQTDYHYEYKQTKHGKFLSLFKFEFLMFWTFFNMQQFIVAELVAFQYMPQNWALLEIIVVNLALLVLCIVPLVIRRSAIKAYTETLFKKRAGKEEFILTVIGFLVMDVFLTLAVTVTFVMYFCLFLVPIFFLVYLFWRQPFRSLWVASRYVVNNVGLLIVFLFYVVLYFLNRYDTLLVPIGVAGVMFIVWIYNLIVFGRELYVWYNYGNQDKYEEMHSERDYQKEKQEQNEYFKGKAKERKNYSFLNNIINKSEKDKDKNLIDDNYKTGRKNDKSNSVSPRATPPPKQPDAIPDHSRQQEEELRRKRERWVRQMQDMKDGKEIRQRTRREMANQQSRPMLRQSQLSRIRNTGMKGVDQRDINETDGRTIRYL